MATGAVEAVDQAATVRVEEEAPLTTVRLGTQATHRANTTVAIQMERNLQQQAMHMAH